MNLLEYEITKTMNRMDEANRSIARTAKREAWPVVGRGRYPGNGKAFVRVTVPAEWRKLEAWRSRECVDVPAEAYEEA